MVKYIYRSRKIEKNWRRGFLDNNQDIKLIALDMDGTLLNEAGEVSQKNRATIKEAQNNGVHVVVSTGRSLITCHNYVKSLALSSYLITGNGSEIWDPNGELVERTPIDPEQIQWLTDLARQYQAKTWAAATNRVWRREMPEDIENHIWLKFGFEIQEDDVRNTIFKHLYARSQFFEISNSSPINIEVNARGVNKARAIYSVCSRLGLSMNQVMAIGDSLNDMAMIKAAGIGVAMGNAQSIVKDSANWVTSSNNDNGVAYAIEKWVFGRN